MVVRRICGESLIFKGSANGEMVQTLILMVPDFNYLMDGIIKEAADSGAANTVSFGFQIQYLADHAGFPKKMAISKRW